MSKDSQAGSQEPHLLDKPLDRVWLRLDFNPVEMGFAPLSLQVLVAGRPAPVDLYLPIADVKRRRVEMKLACPQGKTFLAAWRERLMRRGQRQVFVSLDQGPALMEYFDRYSDEIVDAPGITLKQRAVVVRELAAVNLRLMFASDLTPKALEGSVARAQQTVERLARESQILTNLTAVLRSDYSVYTHSVNVCMLAMAFGRYLDLPPSRIHSLGVGGLLHDVGMARLPAAILDKPGPLNAEERALVRRHPVLGHRLLLPVGAVPYDVLMIVRHHHENADGSGYPDRLSADKTPYLARLLRVVDAYDAMTSRRPYQDARPPFEAAAALIQAMSDQFGGDIVPAFIRFLGSPAFRG